MKLTVKQRELVGRLPVGEWVGVPSGTHIRVLHSLIKRGVIEHRFDPSIPVFIGTWQQRRKTGQIRYIPQGIGEGQ